jgi:hypothetical protein
MTRAQDNRALVDVAIENLLREWWGDDNTGAAGDWDRNRLHQRMLELARAAGIPVPSWAIDSETGKKD